MMGLLKTVLDFTIGIPTKVKLYGAATLFIVIALFRWRAVGIRKAVGEVKRKDEERAQKIRERVAVARSKHPDGDVDIIKRLRKMGAIRND